MWPFGGILNPGGVFLTDKTEHFFVISGIRVHQMIRFENDGSWGEAGFVGLIDNGVYAPYEKEWWAGHPVPGIGAGYEVRNSVMTNGTWTEAAAAVGDWVLISTQPRWGVTQLGGKGGGIGFVNAAGDFEIRQVGGPVLATCNVDLTAEILGSS